MNTLTGLGKTDRERLSRVIRGAKGPLSVESTGQILKTSRTDAAKMLSRWARKGWVSRVRRGWYVPIPLEARSPDVALEEPWVIAERLYTPCYIGGWSAAEYWGLTEQIFRSLAVLTCRDIRERRPVFKNMPFVVRKISDRAFFGLKPVWKGTVKVLVSDPSRTVIDMLSDPSLGGGIRPSVDVLLNYLKSESCDIPCLMSYASTLANGAVFKRLGFLLEQYAPVQKEALSLCRERLTKGNAKLDPALGADKLMTRWRLWVPDNWKREKPSD